jgi:hypothetical protein
MARTQATHHIQTNGRIFELRPLVFSWATVQARQIPLKETS